MLRAAYNAVFQKVVQVALALRHPRSRRWPKFRAQVRSEEPTCAACGGTAAWELHHIELYSEYPELELARDNVIPLCMAPGEKCHLLIGHGDGKRGDWRKANPHVRRDAARKLARRRAEAALIAACAAEPDTSLVDPGSLSAFLGCAALALLFALAAATLLGTLLSLAE